MLEPVKPLTTPTPNFCAARAVFFISSAARLLTPAGSPSPQTCGGRIALCRSSMTSHTAWPTRCAADRLALQAVLLEQRRAGPSQ